MELKDALDKITHNSLAPAQYNWECHAEVLELRDREWFKKYSAMIPEAQLAAWRKTLKETGTLDIDDLADVAELTQRSDRVEHHER